MWGIGWRFATAGSVAEGKCPGLSESFGNCNLCVCMCVYVCTYAYIYVFMYIIVVLLHRFSSKSMF